MTIGTYVRVTYNPLPARLRRYRGRIGKLVRYETLGSCPLSVVKFAGGQEARFTESELRPVAEMHRMVEAT